MITSLPYRRGVGMMLLNAKNQIFMAQRVDFPSDYWQMPQGGIDEGETPHDALLRELQEEIGTANATIMAQTPKWLAYDFPEEWLPRIWGGRFRGQEQQWYLMRYEGTDQEIHLETATPEFSRWQWMDRAQLPHVVIPFKRPLYETLLTLFEPYMEKHS